MKVLIDIGHPAHVHYFRNLAKYFISQNHQVLFTCRYKKVVIDLLKVNEFTYKCIGNPFISISGKLLGLILFDIRLLKEALIFKPDIFLSAGSIYSAHVSFVLRKPHISLEDTFNMEQVRLYLPFSSAVLTGNYKHKKLGKKEISFDGYQELAYLHPLYFSVDYTIKSKLGLNENDKYFIMRFVSWDASHDVGQKRLNIKQKSELTQLLSEFGKVFISSEKDLPEELGKFKFPLTAEYMHQALANADLFVGEGATMAAECAMVGTPVIYINSIELDYMNELERHGLLYHFRDFDGICDKITELLRNSFLKKESIKKSKELLVDKINVTSFLIWFVEKWPKSFELMKKDPRFQNNFK